AVPDVYPRQSHRLAIATFVSWRIIQEMDSAINGAWAIPGQAPHNIKGSLPYRTFPMCWVLSLSMAGSGYVNPRLLRRYSMSLGLPVRKVHPSGFALNVAMYFLRIPGLFSFGFSLIEL